MPVVMFVRMRHDKRLAEPKASELLTLLKITSR
jgi:hypothetical protein